MIASFFSDVTNLCFVGGFGVVRVARMNNRAGGGARQSASPATSQVSTEDEEPPTNKPAPSKFAGAGLRASQPKQPEQELWGAQPAAPDFFAVKIISKHKVLTAHQQQHLRQELKFMGMVDHPFIVKMHGVQ